jgi:hypothetical protein
MTVRSRDRRFLGVIATISGYSLGRKSERVGNHLRPLKLAVREGR